MNNQISQINAEVAAIADRQAPLLAAVQRQAERKNANVEDFAAKTAARASTGEPLTDALRAEAVGTGTSEQVDAIRAEIRAADEALAVSKSKMDREAVEIDAVIASLQTEIDSFAAQALPLHAQLREAQIALLHVERNSRTKAFDAQISQLVALMVRALGAEKYLAELGGNPVSRNSNAGRFCLPAFDGEAATIQSLVPQIDAEAAKLRSEWQIVPQQATAAGNPWGINVMMR